ncbi:toxin glutamine deamidase domain-containing protein [Paludibaculum fermentans]|uniref:Tox-PL domain-containing protein n=1 Tax=Paludibaculum fermentans TaxID=1473598 RepID=A0A7S7SMW1_PALFE|nr:toxin glutamine deamidase domain-containing protein [Paludibaculum fermentans]QOY90353.1 hypothetical protein IRI77_10475 [Paludibaculum fermentans]
MRIPQRAPFFAIVLLLLLSPLHAQNPRPPLQGGVSEEVINPDYRTRLDNQLRIGQLAGDIVGRVSLIGAELHNNGTSTAVHQIIDQEMTELEKYKRSGQYGRIAEQYNPCIQTAFSAEPHLIKAWEAEKEIDRLRVTHTGTNGRVQALVDLYNRESRAAGDLLQSAAECVRSVESKQPWNNPPAGQPPGGNNSPDSPSRPPLRGGAADNGGSGNGTSYYPRVPDPPFQSPCQPDGPGGYNFCDNPNPPPAGCICSDRPNRSRPAPPRPAPNQQQVCGPEPDWVRQYRAEGATPSLRYQVGFNQGVARCLQDQCTIQNLAMAVSAAAFPQVRALLALGSAANVLSAIVNPPGFDPSPDPYVRGNEEGARLCNWMLKLAVPVNSRRLPLVGPGGKVAIPKGFKFYQAVKTVRDWLPNINPSRCVRNCAISTVNTVRVFFGQPLEPAPPNPGRGWTDQQMESAMGARFTNIPGTDVEMYQAIERMPEGTVGVISAESLGSEPGHFFCFVKAGKQVQFWDGQTGMEAMPGNWTFRWMVVGNPLSR